MEFGIQHAVLDSFTAQHSAEKFRSLNSNRTYKNRLLFCMGLLDSLNNRIEFLFFCHINSVFQVFTLYRFVGRDLNNVHSVNITELFFLSKRSTCHTAFFCIFVKEVLESNGCKSFALTFYLYMLLGLNSLMKSVRIAAARHDTSGKFINNQDLIVFYHIILISVHQVVGAESQNNIVLDLQIFRISKVFNIKKFLNLFHTALSQVSFSFTTKSPVSTTSSPMMAAIFVISWLASPRSSCFARISHTS